MATKNDEYVRLGAIVATARREANLTQAEVGDAIGKSREWVNRIESGLDLPVDRDTAGKLASVVRLSPGEFWENVAIARTPVDVRGVWERRILLARVQTEEATESEAKLIGQLRAIGNAIGDPGAYTRALVDLIEGWEFQGSAIMRTLTGTQGAPPAVRVLRLATILRLPTRFGPTRLTTFLAAVEQLVVAFSMASPDLEVELAEGERAFAHMNAAAFGGVKPGCADPSAGGAPLTPQAGVPRR